MTLSIDTLTPLESAALMAMAIARTLQDNDEICNLAQNALRTVGFLEDGSPLFRQAVAILAVGDIARRIVN